MTVTSNSRTRHRLAFAELIGVVEVGKVAASQALVGVDQRLDDLGVDLVADVAIALEGDHILEKLAPLGIMTGEAKSLLFPYLSVMYLILNPAVGTVEESQRA